MGKSFTLMQEVEKLTIKLYRDKLGSEKASPRMEFSETHEELIKEGEIWMKDTANSCTIVTALIVTIVFAAAITVPGGNNSDNGHPIFSKNKAFLTFGVSDGVALFSSTSSLLAFLSILTSRYAEEDFIKVLPRRLIIGLTTLFISIISMMIAFGAILYLVFGDRKPWILAPITALACVPGIQFMSSQFPLLFDMVKYTYRIGVFCKQSDRMFFF
ncbi:ankyrin repeat-containing protein ITN1-like [Cornus florida]|uniref:ankyrin repeat-containing protein ITN1-like n=1 Tax=Cornus florida TaxID=4283 RepID=UPI00289F68D4|nr:ankyrin repeat-containing protein ITN1-like [Cornus florida]